MLAISLLTILAHLMQPQRVSGGEPIGKPAPPIKPAVTMPPPRWPKPHHYTPFAKVQTGNPLAG